MLGGGPAAGKSTMLKSSELKDIPLGGKGAVEVNPDLFKELLPEYQAMLAAGDSNAAAFTHEESSYLAVQLQADAIANGQDLIIDGVGASYDKTIALAQPAGYRIQGYYAFVDPELAVQRAVDRGVKTGRYVMESYIRERHQKVAQIFEDAAGKMDSIALYDTTDGARKVASAEKGVLKVTDQEAYDRFLGYGKPSAIEEFLMDKTSYAITNSDVVDGESLVELDDFYARDENDNIERMVTEIVLGISKNECRVIRTESDSQLYDRLKVEIDEAKALGQMIVYDYSCHEDFD